MKKIIALITALMVVLAMSFAAPSMVNAAPECTEVVTIVDSPASSEVVHHPAVTHTETVTVTDSEAFDEKVIDSPAVEAVIGQWWNWSPNNTQGPQDYTPLFPVDVRGTWQGPHTEGGPEGEGTFNVSHGESGNSSWFHRVLAVEGSPEVSHIVHHDAVTHEESTEVVDSPAFNTTTNHPAVTHDETKAVDCGDSGTPDSPDNPNSPVTVSQPNVPDDNCDDLTFAQAQNQLANGNEGLDADNDGVACERTPRLKSAPVPTVVDSGL